MPEPIPVFHWSGKRLLLAVVGFCVVVPLLGYLGQAVSYARFSRQIAQADRVVVAGGDSRSVTVTGEDVGKLVRAIASAHRDTGHYRAKFSFETSFYRGTNYLGEVEICSHLFRARGCQYRAGDDTLKRLVVGPFLQTVDQ